MGGFLRKSKKLLLDLDICRRTDLDLKDALVLLDFPFGADGFPLIEFLWLSGEIIPIFPPDQHDETIGRWIVFTDVEKSRPAPRVVREVCPYHRPAHGALLSQVFARIIPKDMVGYGWLNGGRYGNSRCRYCRSSHDRSCGRDRNCWGAGGCLSRWLRHDLGGDDRWRGQGRGWRLDYLSKRIGLVGSDNFWLKRLNQVAGYEHKRSYLSGEE